jgi:hypothetical protein
LDPVTLYQDPHLLAAGGSPTFLLGDTAWELLHRLRRDEILHYLDARAQQGFNLICTVILAEFDGLRIPNAEGEVPLVGLNPTRPNPRYLDLVHFLLRSCEERGLYVGLLPTWGDKLTAPWGVGPRIFHIGEEAVAEEFGHLLGASCIKANNLLWILGGDRPARLDGIPEDWPYPWDAGFTKETDFEPIWRAMAKGLRRAIPGALIAYHPQGGQLSASQLLPDAEWLDINMIQSGHGGGHDVPTWEMIARDYKVSPAKPTLDAEPNYEGHPVSPWPAWNPLNGYFDDYDVRKQCYRSVFAGGCAVIYGHHSVWQFWDSSREPILIPKTEWTQAIFSAGAKQLGILRRLMDDFGDRVPDDSILLDPGAGASRRCALRSPDGARVMVYLPTPEPISVRLTHSGDLPIRWVSPLSGEAIEVLAAGAQDSVVWLKPPQEFGPDWVVIIDTAGR